MSRANSAAAVAVPKPADWPQLRVVGHEGQSTGPRFRTVALFGSLFIIIVFVTLLVVAVLHALHVQTQVEIDSVRATNAELESRLTRRLAERAELDAPVGVLDAAAGGGLVEASDLVMLSVVPEGLLAPPAGGDPFSGSSP